MHGGSVTVQGKARVLSAAHAIGLRCNFESPQFTASERWHAWFCSATAVPPGMASLASELGSNAVLEVELSQSLNMVAEEEGASQAALHNGNGLLPALPLSYGGGGGAAAAASATGQQEQQTQQQQGQQQAPQQQDQAERQAVSSAVSGSSVQLSAPTSVRGCCCGLRAFWTDFQVRWHVMRFASSWSSTCAVKCFQLLVGQSTSLMFA
jgi:hypothetical protein